MPDTHIVPPTRKRITEILASETGGKSYKAHKYSLNDPTRPLVEYGDSDALQWAEYGETKQRKTYIDLTAQSKALTTEESSLIRYFLDGSRHVYKVDEMGFEKGGKRSVIYPIVAGQIGVGCCRRDKERRMHSKDFCGEVAIAVPDIANADGGDAAGYFQGLAKKIKVGSTLASRLGSGWEFSRVFHHSTANEKDVKFEDLGTAKIQDRMYELEQGMVARLVAGGRLNQDNYLVKDGSLEYNPTKEMRDDPTKYKRFKNNYDFVIGVSKGFNPSICKDSNGKSNPGFIAELPLFSRTPAAKYRNEMLGDVAFAVWYIRIRDQAHTRSLFDGIVKVEKILVTDCEVAYGMDSDLVDLLSAYLVNERNPVCYGADLRWANHLYPVYLTEHFVKSHYISEESFLHMF
jgi:hypothetical protein